MNYSTAVFLINEDVRALYCTYESHDDAPKTLFKTFDQSIKEDDYVVVPTSTRHKMTVCKVVEVDVDFDIETTEQVAWIVGVVDQTGFQDTMEKESEAIEAIKKAELRQKRKRLRAALLEDHEESIAALPIAKQAAIEADS